LTGAAGRRPVRRDHQGRFGLLTYRKNEGGKETPQVADDAFTVMTWRGDDGRDRAYDIADTRVTLTIASGGHKGEVLTCGRSPAATRESRYTSSPPAARMSCPPRA
jgi:hypothetical protein